MAPISHPGRLLKRELVARKLGANRLSLDIGVPCGRITDILNSRRSITAIRRCGSGATLATARSSGSTCRASMTLPWSSARKARKSQSASGRRMRRESEFSTTAIARDWA
jgi:hypothetical protein